MAEHPHPKKLTVGDRLRARAGNRALLMQRLNDPERRVAEVILNAVADCIDEMEEPEVKVPKVVKRAD